MPKRNVTINRLPTGVPGLDEVLGGGLPELSFNVIAGAPGCGKTTLAYQIMFALATHERPCLYFSALGEPPLLMLRYQQQFAFFDNKKVNTAVRFISLAEETDTGDFDKVLARIAVEVEAHGPSLVFIDSFLSVVLAGHNVGDPPRKLNRFIQHLRGLMLAGQATTLLMGEYLSENELNPAFTIADGLIWLRQSVQRNSVVRKMEIMKMRGQPSVSGLHTFRISGAGITVVPPVHLTPRPAKKTTALPIPRLHMGVPGLDEMLGGGLPRGYSLLVAGPSGSGKSIMASAFMAEGARNNETSVIAAFEQRPIESRGPVIAELIQSGRVGVVDTRALNLSVDEISALLITEIGRLKATRVVIDSLSGFELALAPTFRDDFRESMSRMMSALASTGATVMITSELEDRYMDLRFSPFGTAFLTDAIIVQRYIEVDSKFERVMGVVKLRASAHSNELRLFHIDDAGIRLGQMLADHEGLLGGSPTRVATPRTPSADSTLIVGAPRR